MSVYEHRHQTSAERSYVRSSLLQRCSILPGSSGLSEAAQNGQCCVKDR